MIKWNEVTWYSRWGAIILFLVVVPMLCFYIGKQYEAIVSEKTAQLVTPSIVVKKDQIPSSISTPNVAGYYSPTLRYEDKTYIQVKQTGNMLTVTGYTSYANLVGDLNTGSLNATSTIDSNGVARINLSMSSDESCFLYLIFYPLVTSTEAQSTNTLRVVATNSGFACGFGNNVSFDLGDQMYEKQNVIPDTLPSPLP